MLPEELSGKMLTFKGRKWFINYHLQIKRVNTCKFLKFFTEFPTLVDQIHYFLSAKTQKGLKSFLIEREEGKDRKQLDILVSVPQTLITRVTNKYQKDRSDYYPDYNSWKLKGKHVTWIKDDYHNPRKSFHEIVSSKLQLRGKLHPEVAH